MTHTEPGTQHRVGIQQMWASLPRQRKGPQDLCPQSVPLARHMPSCTLHLTQRVGLTRKESVDSGALSCDRPQPVLKRLFNLESQGTMRRSLRMFLAVKYFLAFKF